VITRLLLLLLSLPVGATVFQMQTIDQQIKDSDGIIIGHYLRKKSIKLENGSLATQMIFKMNKEVGMQSELFGMDEIIIHYPGGKLGDQHVKVDGVPEFVSGENVILMVKSSQDRFWGMNLGFGSFKVINYGNQKMIVNTLFPNDRNVGQVSMEDFEKTVKLIKKSSFKVVMAPSYPSESGSETPLRMPATVEEGKNRTIASISEGEENRKDQTEFTSVWLVLFLAMLGGVFRLIRQKEAK
jgi:hypothetical protein